MTRFQSLAILEALIPGRWNLIAGYKARGDLNKAEKRAFVNQYKLEIEALQMARDALRNPGYVSTGVKENGLD